MMINVIRKEEINCESFISQLWVSRLNQMKNPAVENQSNPQNGGFSGKRWKSWLLFKQPDTIQCSLD